MNEIVSRDGHTLDELTNGDLRILVSRSGAELVSLAKCDSAGEWQGFLVRDGDVSKNPKGWSNHSTVMGYYIHRILNEKTNYRGHKVKGGTHSFLRHKTFAPPAVNGNQLTYRFNAQNLHKAEYPYQVDFAITYILSNKELQVRFDFENHEDIPTHVSFGLHPGFAVTDLNQMKVLLPPGRYVRHLAPGNFLSGETLTIDFNGGLMPFPVGELPGSFLLDLAGVPERIFILEDPLSGRKITLNFTEAPYLTLWSDGNAFICIEPCWGLPDHHAQRPFEEKLGMETIAPHGLLQRGFSINPDFFEFKG